MRRPTPALVRVLVAAGALALIVTSVVLSPSRDVSREARAVVGEQEMVRITGPTGKTVEALARVDTGASASSMDTEIANRLDFDLKNAEKITVGSSLGREERPVVEAALQVAGTAAVSRMSVSDRTERSTPVLLGRADLRGAQVVIGQRLLTTPGSATAPSALQAIMAKSPALGPLALLALLPLAALLIVLLRVVVGLGTLGTFSPVLLAFGYTQAGLLQGLVLTLVMFALGFASQPVLRLLHLPRVARLSVLIGVVAFTLLAVRELAGVQGAADSWGAALPVVVTAVIVERLWETWDLDGARAALAEASITLAVAVVVTLLLLAPATRLVAETVPLQLAVACTVWAAVAGTYRGLRLLELVRFAPAARTVEVPA